MSRSQNRNNSLRCIQEKKKTCKLYLLHASHLHEAILFIHKDYTYSTCNTVTESVGYTVLGIGRNIRHKPSCPASRAMYWDTMPESSLAIRRQIKYVYISSKILFQSLSVAKKELRASKLSTITRTLTYRNAIIFSQFKEKKTSMDLNSMKWGGME